MYYFEAILVYISLVSGCIVLLYSTSTTCVKMDYILFVAQHCRNIIWNL